GGSALDAGDARHGRASFDSGRVSATALDAFGRSGISARSIAFRDSRRSRVAGVDWPRWDGPGTASYGWIFCAWACRAPSREAVAFPALRGERAGTGNADHSDRKFPAPGRVGRPTAGRIPIASLFLVVDGEVKNPTLSRR